MQNAMYCLNGHYVGVVNPILRARNSGQLRAMMERASQHEGQERLPAFCTRCGTPNISACQHCQAPIELRHMGSKPGYCGGCGKPFPWTETALSAAKAYTDELDQLSPEEKTTLKETFDDLTIDTARTPLAANRFKKFMSKIGPSAAGAVGKIVEAVATEAAKKMLGL
jgi:hypothetical protein